ncbi:hypothetical protein [Vibrio sp. SCSIO 43136]|uniref:hypothetical protein n=1 Tax=Vibrio sp. SCSIO 43136 TaxID=2819101 RepID=UPI0020750FF6|nr:hypothetical protein [Vibrio sp. SCSIO 43136]USD66448.1 hypothetical protein J4N39_06465 [Vibrio sp. SCSIO 43136]
MIVFSTVLISRKTGNRAVGVTDHFHQYIIDRLYVIKTPDAWLELVSEAKALSESEPK